ncbi:MAG: hypothetical protein HQL54_10625 [Magnetococcales bacterium]|nr:hypothetical protein [Magnetococcales bacterium]
MDLLIPVIICLGLFYFWQYNRVQGSGIDQKRKALAEKHGLSFKGSDKTLCFRYEGTIKGKTWTLEGKWAMANWFRRRRPETNWTISGFDAEQAWLVGPRLPAIFQEFSFDDPRASKVVTALMGGLSAELSKKVRPVTLSDTDFHKRFDLLSTDDKQLRKVLTPQIRQILMQHPGGLTPPTVRFKGGALLIQFREVLAQPKDIEAAMAMGQAITKKLIS